MPKLDYFESTPSGEVKPVAPLAVPARTPKTMDQRLSEAARQLKLSSLRAMTVDFSGIQDVVSMAGGLPPPSAFPIRSIEMDLADGQRVVMANPAMAQQYNLVNEGWPALTEKCRELTSETQRPYGGMDGYGVAVTAGGTHALDLISLLLLERGDGLLVEEYHFPVLREVQAALRGYDVRGAAVDEGGLVPELLERQLEACERDTSRPFPKILYTVPHGQNPTGSTISPERKRRIYEICCKYDIIILEDDPYFFLNWGPSEEAATRAPGDAPTDPPTPIIRGLMGHEPGYLSLDRDRRVVRVDTFSKFFAPGTRLAWVTADQALTSKIADAVAGSTCGACSMTQCMVADVLGAWGREGLDRHLRSLQTMYASKAAVAASYARAELGDLVDFAPPTAGMFLWVRIRGVRDSAELWPALKEARVLVVPARLLHVDHDNEAFSSQYMRVSFSFATQDQLREGMRRLGVVVRGHIAAQKKQVLAAAGAVTQASTVIA